MRRAYIIATLLLAVSRSAGADDGRQRWVERELTLDRGAEIEVRVRAPRQAGRGASLDFLYFDFAARVRTARAEFFGGVGLAAVRDSGAEVLDRGFAGARVPAGSRGALRTAVVFLEPTESERPSRFALQGVFELERPLGDRLAFVAEGGFEFVNRLWGKAVAEPEQTWWSLSALAVARGRLQATERLGLEIHASVQVPLAANPGESEPDAVLGASYEPATAVNFGVRGVVAATERLDVFAEVNLLESNSDFSFSSQNEDANAIVGAVFRLP